MKRVLIVLPVLLGLMFLASLFIANHSLENDLSSPKLIDQTMCHDVDKLDNRDRRISLRKRVLFEGGNQQAIYTLEATIYDLTLKTFWSDHEVDAALEALC